MKTVKLSKGLAETYNLEPAGEEYQEAVQNRRPYVVMENNIRKYYALCCICEQPVRINGLDKLNSKKSVYASHAGKNVEGLADNNLDAMRECTAYLGGKVDRSSETKLVSTDKEVQTVLKTLLDNYDKVVYFVEQQTGLHITNELARKMLSIYVHNEYWNHRDTRNNNIPWILFEGLGSLNLTSCIVKENSELYEAIKKIKGYSLIKTSQIPNCYFVRAQKGSKPLILVIPFMKYNSTTQNEELSMRIEVRREINENYDRKKMLLKTIRLPINSQSINYFVRLCTKYDKWKPNKTRLAIAEEILKKYIIC